mgnify:CR=1 FL=1
MEDNFISRLYKYMEYAGLNENKVRVQCGLSQGAINTAKKRNKGLGYENIAKILYVYKDLDARWLLTGEGEMLNSERTPSDSELIQFLKKQNNELLEKIEQLNRELGYKERQIAEMKKEYAPIGLVADSADAKSYGLVK